MSIQICNEINESHAATGYMGRSDLPAFHIFTVEETYPSTRQVMPPYRFHFYQVVMLENSSDATFSMNTRPVPALNDSLTFASPQHVLAWMRGEKQQGFIVYFKEEFLGSHQVEIQAEFPFFRLNAINLLPVTPAEKQPLRDHLTNLLNYFQHPHPYRTQMLQAALLLLLYECKALYRQQEAVQAQLPSKDLLMERYRQFINQHFLTRKCVEEYADLLGISPDYLGQVVRQATGKSPSTMISERIILEAKNLLSYTSLQVTEVADYLGFIEPTHFGRFFHRHVGISPQAWRAQQ